MKLTTKIAECEQKYDLLLEQDLDHTHDAIEPSPNSQY